MQIERPILEIFNEMKPDNELRPYIEAITVTNINVYSKSKKLEIIANASLYIPAGILEKIEKLLVVHIGLDRVLLRPKFLMPLTLEEILNEYTDDITKIINSKMALSIGVLAGCRWELDGQKIRIYLKNKASYLMNKKKCDELIQDLINDRFSYRTKVEFIDEDSICELSTYFEEKAQEEEKIIKKISEQKIVPQKPVDTKDKKTYVERKKAEKSIPLPPIDNADIIFGKNFGESTISINKITAEDGKVAILGEIFRVESREIRSGKTLFIFDVTDLTNSITVKFFANPDKAQETKNQLKEGLMVKIRGEVQYDKYTKEIAMFSSDIIKIKKVIKKDTAEVKRVELHLHTQMSSMDAVNSVKEMVKRAADYGHTAIAITDHGVVQSFPDAMEASKKNKVKILYGVECYLLDDDVPVVYGGKEHSLDDTFVVFDIETTGLYADRDKITEIGAVKVKAGKIVDKFSTFVNPEIPIPYKIVELTGITDDMVKGAPKVREALLDFLEFANESVLVAHNATFDMGFIRKFAKANGCKIEHPVLDTLQLSRRLLPELKKHKLNLVAKHLGIELINHHRAVDDSSATSEIMLKFFEMLKAKGAETIEDIDKCLDNKSDFKKMDTYHAIILVKNYVGLKNLYKIISESHLQYFHKKPRVPKKLLMQYRDGLLVGSACEAGELYQAILSKKGEDEIEKIIRLYDYLEIQPIANNRFLIENGRIESEKELEDLNRMIVELGDKYHKKVVATCDVHFVEPHDEVFRRILMAGQGFSDADNQAPLYYRTTEEMLKEFEYLGHKKAYEVVVTNTNEIADMLDEILPIPDGTYPPFIEGAEEEIETLAMGNAKEIYGDPLPDVVNKRLDKELSSIIKNGFAVMYIIAQKLVWKSLSDGYLVGSRGSVGSSFVANMVGITEVNSLPPHYICNSCKSSEFIEDGSVGCGFDLPSKNCPNCGSELTKDGYDIPFETFLGFDGDKEPDIDLNFSGEYQANAHKYTEELFGKGNVFRAGTIGTIADKTAYGFIKNYLDEKGMIVSTAEINRLVKGCTGVKRTTGQHPGGLMIVPQDREIYEFCPIQRPADDVESNIITTHFDYHSISGRLLKLDILGHDDPTAIRMLEDLTGVNARLIPIGEKETMGIFSGTEALKVKPEDINSDVGTFAIPEFGTKFVRQMLVDTRPTSFSELIRISGLSHGTDVWLNNAQELVRSDTASLSEVICTRDDIMLYLIYAGLPPKTSFKIMEDVRKGKGLKEEYIQIMKENNIPEWYINSCNKIKYMFPKAHAAAYVMMAFRIAWFKVHYPEAFYVTYFTVRADDFDATLMAQGQDKVKRSIREYEQKGNEATQKEKNVLTILEVANEMYARGIKFLPVDIYESDATKFINMPTGIRPPLNALQGLGTSAAQNILEARKNGKFVSIDEFRIRASISKAVIEILSKNGSLRGLPESNQISFF